MLSSYQSGTAKRVSPVLTFLLGSITAVSFSCSCLADPLPSPASTGSDWNPGPATGALGSVGEIRVPSGYKFLDTQAARAYLQQHNQAAPRNLLGILAPSTESWLAVLQFSDQGYVPHPEKEMLDPGKLLNVFSPANANQTKAQTAPAPTTASAAQWEQVPVYDAQAHAVQWAVRKPAGTSQVVVQSLSLLARRGSVDATVVSAYRGYRDLAPLDTLAKDFSLKAGERYEDYQAGDKLATAGLAALVKDTGMSTDSTPATGSKSTLARTLWLGGAGAACVLVFSGIWIYVRASGRKTRRNRAPERQAQPTPAPAPAAEVTRPKLISTPVPAPTPTSAAVMPSQPKVERPLAKAPLSSKPVAPAFQSRTEALRKPLNGKNHGPRRRKVFDYNRYFTDLMGAVSAHSQMEPTGANGVSLEPSRLSLPVNGVDHNGAAAPVSTADQQAEILASQRELIEEQKRLIQEQTKLIEEKSRLIAEKNELLKLQNQFMADKLV